LFSFRLYLADTDGIALALEEACLGYFDKPRVLTQHGMPASIENY
jgi:hypothetical protein